MVSYLGSHFRSELLYNHIVAEIRQVTRASKLGDKEVLLVGTVDCKVNIAILKIWYIQGSRDWTLRRPTYLRLQYLYEELDILQNCSPFLNGTKLTYRIYSALMFCRLRLLFPPLGRKILAELKLQFLGTSCRLECGFVIVGLSSEEASFIYRQSSESTPYQSELPKKPDRWLLCQVVFSRNTGAAVIVEKRQYCTGLCKYW